MDKKPLLAVKAIDVPARTIRSVYPEPFASMMEGREKRALGDFFGLKNIGINLTSLESGAQSALLHKHTLQEEFIYILAGQPTLVTDQGEVQLQPGMCAGFSPAGPAHHLVNRSADKVLYLELGNRVQGDGASYPSDDLLAELDANHQWQFTHKNGESY